jgi:hypothetical protein
MRLRTILSLGPVLVVVACGGSSDPAAPPSPPAEQDVTSSHSSQHDVFVCHSDQAPDPKGITMFAFDQQALLDNDKKGPGFCEIAIDSQAKPIDTYLCEVSGTDTAKTNDGQLALLFTKFLGDGLELLHQYNLPKDLVEKKGGKGTMRALARRPHDLTQPNPTSGVEHVDCKLETVTFPTL